MPEAAKGTRKAGPKARFEEINERLKSDKYNAETRRINRNYLSKYLESKAETGSNLVGKRRGEAERLLKALNSKGVKTVKASPPKLKPTKKASPKKASPPKALYEQLDVKGDGNCYYRSLYRAAAEHEDPTVLAKVFTILGADKKGIKEEETGQAALRAAVANIYRTRFGERFGPYEMLKSNYGSRQFKGWVREATKGQAAVYKKVLDYKSKAGFYTALADVIARNKEYASDIDYMIISEFLEGGGVKVITSYDSPKSSSWNGMPALYIKRLSYDHYNYWRVIKKSPTPDPVNSGSDERREALEEKIREKKDKHQRCVEKCKAVAVKIKKLEGDLKELN
jgi:hypothetical protein